MEFNYPNGVKRKPAVLPKNESKTAQKRTKGIPSSQIYANRGMTLEEELNQSNEYYLTHGIASLHKKPTPIQIVKVDYPNRSAAVIKEAYFKTPSTTDYNGVYKGYHLDFEAKESKNKTSFPLSNFHEHQIQHMKSVMKQNGICFVVIRFTELNETYVLESKHVIDFWEKKEEERKSIPKPFIEQMGVLVPDGYHPRLDFIKAVDKLFQLNHKESNS